LIGEFIAGEIITGSSNEVWEKIKEDICYQKDEVISCLESGARITIKLLQYQII
jgi:hypothetical protein